MNRGVFQSSPVQQMMANPNWWSINSAMRPPPPAPQSTTATTIHPFMPNTTTNFTNLLFPHQFTPTSSSSSSSSPSLSFPSNCYDAYQLEQFPESWSQLVLSGYGGHEDVEKIGNNIVNGMSNHPLDHHHHHQAEANKRPQNWEEQQILDKHSPNNCSSTIVVDHGKQEKNYLYGGHANSEEYSFHGTKSGTAWSPKSSSCITTFTTNNVLDFSNVNKALNHPPPDRSSEIRNTMYKVGSEQTEKCNSNANSGSAQKKARLQSSSAQSTFKVRKEKLGDRITALHQLVSPFGKTDTASVLLEAIGYIRFLQGQIEALSSPYLGGSNSRNMRQQHLVQGERNSVFPEDPGQLVNDNCIKRKEASQQDSNEEPKKDLRSRGLCLVPISCTLQVGSENGADYWAPAPLGGGFR